MAKLIHPGVYIEETSRFPPAIKQEETSVTIFIGYTENITGTLTDDLKLKPVAVKSFSEFTSIFGNSSPDRYLYDSVNLFFQNGGGECFIISTGDYQAPVSLNDFTSGLNISKTVAGQLLVIPDAVLLTLTELSNLQQLILKSCADLQDRFCILDIANRGSGTKQDIVDFRFGIGNNNLKWGAAYYPWLILANNKKVPPSGAIAGIYAQVDKNRGVSKAPANVSINGIKDLSTHVSNQDQAMMNVDTTGGKSVNAIRAFTGKGFLVWGSRSLAGNDNEWRYISVCRLFIMVEQSIRKSTEWAVFEPNDANTWLKIKTTADNYLYLLWRDGSLAGSKPDEAFYTRVAINTTMTAQDILEGRLIIEIGMAPVRPAEFIIIRITHKIAGA